MWRCEGCGGVAEDSIFLKYQLKQLHFVILKDSDGRVWLRCDNGKKKGHASCIYSKNESMVMKLDKYTCCHSSSIHKVMQKINKRDLYGNKLVETDGGESDN